MVFKLSVRFHMLILGMYWFILLPIIHFIFDCTIIQLLLIALCFSAIHFLATAKDKVIISRQCVKWKLFHIGQTAYYENMRNVKIAKHWSQRCVQFDYTDQSGKKCTAHIGGMYDIHEIYTELHYLQAS